VNTARSTIGCSVRAYTGTYPPAVGRFELTVEARAPKYHPARHSLGAPRVIDDHSGAGSPLGSMACPAGRSALASVRTSGGRTRSCPLLEELLQRNGSLSLLDQRIRDTAGTKMLKINGPLLFVTGLRRLGSCCSGTENGTQEDHCPGPDGTSRAPTPAGPQACLGDPNSGGRSVTLISPHRTPIQDR
jgi:hypothetical protein